jgi:hypothetical protein
MSAIDPGSGSLRIDRVDNGWVVFSGTNFAMNCGGVPTTHVARTPKELADLVMGWAQAQNDLPTLHPPRQP